MTALRYACPDCGFRLMTPRRCGSCQQRHDTAALTAITQLVDHARKISPSPSMTVYVADIERALGMNVARPHKLGAKH